MFRYITVLFFLSLGMRAFSSDTVRVESGRYGIDKDLKWILVNKSPDEIRSACPGMKEAFFLDELYTLSKPLAEVSPGQAYRVENERKETYTLYLTELPLIFIASEETIVDEPKVRGHFTLTESNGTQVDADMGIELRGGYTQHKYAKKSFRIEFRDYLPADTVEKDYSLLGLRSDDDWDLQAMANEPLRMNEKTSFDIWRKIHTLSYADKEPEAIGSCRMKYAELFLNGSYQGVYCVSEPIDRKQLKLKKYKVDTGIRGELYEAKGYGPTTFDICPDYPETGFAWIDKGDNGYYCKYPKEVYPDWRDLYDFVESVIFESYDWFFPGYRKRFDMQSAVDYFILLNLSRACDNTGNNLFVARYDAGLPFFYVPWDLDGTFGNKWNGSRDTITTDLLSNGFYDRLLREKTPGGFVETLESKWKQLRKDWLTVDGVMEMFEENHRMLMDNAVYEREERVWGSRDLYAYDPTYMAYMREWIAKRIAVLDGKFLKNGVDVPKVVADRWQYPCEVLLYDGSGSLLRRMSVASADDDRWRENLSAGTYFVRFRGAGFEETTKLVMP